MSTYINNMDPNVALEILQRENPTKIFKIHDKGYIARRRDSNEKVWDRVCIHNKKPMICAKCKNFYKNDDSIVRKGCVAPQVYGPKTQADADPFYNREIKVAPVFPANLTVQEIIDLQAILLSRGVVLENDCIVFNDKDTNSWNTNVDFRDKTYRLHQIAWISLNNRLLPDGFVIRHKCKTKDCFNANHLDIGTKRENMFEDRLRDKTLPHGEKHFNAKSSNEQILEIFYSKGTGTREQRAKRFGITVSKVKKIDSGQSWSHVTGYHKGSIQRREHQQVHRETVPRSSATKEDYNNLIENIKKHSIQKVNGCIETDYAKDVGGYSVVGMIGHQTKAHIVVWEFYHNDCKPAAEGMIVRHKCDNAGCCNKDHLEFGTYGDNIKDQYARGRRAIVGKFKNQNKAGIVAAKSKDTEIQEISKMQRVSQMPDILPREPEEDLEEDLEETEEIPDSEFSSNQEVSTHLLDEGASYISCLEDIADQIDEQIDEQVDEQSDCDFKRKNEVTYGLNVKRRKT